MRVDCKKRGKKISPLIYSVAWEPDARSDAFALGSVARRWGGNTTSRYNWELGDAWATGSDWFFENVETRPVSVFFAENRAHGMTSALTVPMIGWVAKDKTSSSFPVSSLGAQEQIDKGRPEAGNGKGRDGKLLAAGPPTRTSVPAPPELVARWIESLKKSGALAGGMAILDNEPSLWSSTHRDVHPDPVTYDELLDRSIRYATAIKKADPSLRVAGPAEWGWLGYLYSAKDKADGIRVHSDRRAHGNEELVAYYLRKMKEASDQSGTRLLDLLDLHFYPQGDKVFSDADDPKTAALRIRQTRGLWDRSYVDESWIGEAIYLLPRMREWVDASSPGVGLMIGEWNFGGEKHMSGGLAVAEALGRFAENHVDAAFYWTVPPNDSPAAHGFRAYRDFDGKGGRFLDYFVPSTAPAGTSLFASRDAAGSRLVLVALNLSPDSSVLANVDLGSCGEPTSVSAHTYSGTGVGFAPTAASGAGGVVSSKLAAYSITVIEVGLAAAITAGVDE